MFLADALNPRQNRANLENPDVPLFQALTGMGEKAWTGRAVGETQATHLSVVHGILKVFSESVQQLPLNLYRRSGPQNRELDTDDRRGVMLRHRVNPTMTAHTFRGLILSHCLGWGNFYAEIERNRLGQAVNLWPLPPDRVKRVVRASTAGGAMLDQFEYQDPEGGEPIVIPSRNMLHMFGLTLDGFTGVNPLRHAMQHAALGLALEEYTSRFAANDVMPSGILFSDANIGADARKKLQEDFDQNFKGMANKHRMAILTGGFKYQQLSVDPASAQILETRRFVNEDFCRIYRCPAHLVAILADASFNNIENLDVGFVKHSLLPWLRMIERSLLLALFEEKEWDSWEFEHVPDALLRGDPEKQAKVWETFLRMGVVTSDWVRARLGENPRDDGLGDKFLLSVQHQFAEDVKAEAEATIEQIQSQASAGDGSEEDPLDDPPEEEDSERQIPERFVDTRAVSDPEWTAESREITIRALAPRRRVVERPAIRRLFEQSIARVVAIEDRTVRKLAKSHLKARDIASFRDAVQEELEALRPDMARQIAPAMDVFREELVDVVRSELDVDEDTPTPPSDNFATRYAETWALRHTEETVRGLEADLDPTLDDPTGELEKRLDGWKRNRPGSEARDEQRRFGNALAALLFGGFGFSRLRWVAVGKDCPICEQLDGTVVRNGEPFATAGTELGPGFTLKKRMGHPPAHKACDCMAAPVR